MSGDCCQNKSCELEQLQKQHSKVLWIVLLINATMFVVELVSGLRAKSLSLTGDSLDMLGDALVYGGSLVVIYKSSRAQARVALLKGVIMLASALTVLIRGLYQLHNWTIPAAETMTQIGFLALAANLVCLFLLTRHRDDNLNMSSVWLCSRNDIIANSLVIVSAWIIAIHPSPLPDIVVGFFLTAVFTKSSVKVISASRKQLIG
jgi:Co/Zn/Cd efflux system component